MQKADPEFDVLVIGSGPSGSHAAHEAVTAGCKVALLDVGYTNPRLQNYIPAKPFSEIRSSDPNQSQYFLSDDPATVLRNQDRAGPHLTPARQHMIRNMDVLFPLESDTFLPLQATGSGGLGISWGANCFAYEDFELVKAGIAPDEIKPHYVNAALEAGVSGRTDDCTAPLIANMDHSAIQKPLPIDTNAETILKHYTNKKEKHNREGFFLGQSLLAMLSRPIGDRSANPLFDMDYWADHGRSVYRPQFTIEKLEKSANFTYLTGRLATEYSEDGGVVTVHCRNLETGALEQFTTRKLLLAAGALNSGRLALYSAKNFTQRLPILCNRNHWVAAINLSMLGRPARDARHSLSQLTALMKTDFDGPDYVLAQVYSYRSLLWFRILKNIPLSPRLGSLFLRFTATAFTCINLHYPDHASPNRWIQLKQQNGDAVLQSHCEFSAEEEAWLSRNERRLLLFLAKLRCIPLGVSKPMHGASIHYAGTLPYSAENKPFTTEASGRLRGTENVYVADSSSWRFLSGKGLTLTLMANARRVAAQALHDLKLKEHTTIAAGEANR
jgi:choline dehydrogenase-like flavoprotein